MPEETMRLADCTGTHHTAKAVCVSIPALGEEVWVPQSVIDVDSEVFATGHKGTLVVHAWWANKQGWI